MNAVGHANSMKVVANGYSTEAVLHPNVHHCLPAVLWGVVFLLCVHLVSGCTPTVQVTASDKPIEVNLNVKIEHEIRIKVDKEIDELFSDDDVF